jgi:hypothetical protein
MIRLVARLVGWFSLTGVLVVAGIHTVYYLFIWEWVRAQIAGTAFVAALVVMATVILLERIRRLEERLVSLTARGAIGEPQRAEPVPEFPWLSAGPEAIRSVSTRPAIAVAVVIGLAAASPRTAVFIPVLLAAGVVVSVLAGAVERLAVFLYGGPRPRPDGDRAVSTTTALRERRGALIALPLVGAAVTAGLIGGLYWVAHYWSDPIGQGVTRLTVQVETKGPTGHTVGTVQTLGRYCALNTGIGVRVVGVDRRTADSADLRVAPLLDEDARRRYVGCLEDSILEWHRLDVTATQLVPAEEAAPAR